MNFVATVLGTAVTATVIVSHMQGAPAYTLDHFGRSDMVDGMITGSTVPAAMPATTPPPAVRLIDLRSGASCRAANPSHLGPAFSPAPLGPSCAGSPDLRNVSQWRATKDGTLEMADSDGRTVIRFMPGDGVLYESIYPKSALVTIVPARG